MSDAPQPQPAKTAVVIPNGISACLDEVDIVFDPEPFLRAIAESVLKAILLEDTITPEIVFRVDHAGNASILVGLLTYEVEITRPIAAMVDEYAGWIDESDDEGDSALSLAACFEAAAAKLRATVATAEFS